MKSVPSASNESSSQSTISSELQTQEEPKIEAKTMATTAMTDNMTIGMEQIVVSVSLLLISLYYLARPASKLKLRQLIKKFCGGQLFRKSKEHSSNGEDDDRKNEIEMVETTIGGGTLDSNMHNDTNVNTAVHCNGIDDDASIVSRSMHQSKMLNVRFSPIRSNTPPPSPPVEQSIPSPLRKVQSAQFINNNTPRSLGKGDWQSMSYSSTSTTSTKNKITNNSTIPSHSNLSINTTSTNNNSSIKPLTSPQHHGHPQPQDPAHEHFLHAYEKHIKISSYRKLVLPPQCRLIDPVKMRMALKKEETRRQLSNLLENLRRIWTFDYMGFTFHVNYRICVALITRWYKAMGWKQEDVEKEDLMAEREDDEEEADDADGNDDGTVESSKSMASSCVGYSSNNNYNGTMAGTSTPKSEMRDRFYSTVGTSASNDGIEDFKDTSSLTLPDWEDESSTCPQAPFDTGKKDSHQQKEEKTDGDEMPNLDVMCSAHSTLSQTGKEFGKNNIIDDVEVSDNGQSAKNKSHRTITPTNPKRFLLPKPTSTKKIKDQLEKYRRGGTGNDPNPLTGKNISCGSIASNNSSISSIPGNVNKSVSTSASLSLTSSVPPVNSVHPLPVSNIDGLNATELIYFDAAANNPDQEGYILGDELLADPRDTPLLVFVNTRSGSQQGLMLKVQLRQLLNPIQVWDLADGGPEKVLESFSVLTHLRILVCGGDGTVSWIISALDKMQLKRWPPIAILPLGTGNDLARVHGWGTGYANESLLLILNQVKEAYISLLDRWKITIEVKKEKRTFKAFTNYMSIGMDALSALQLHNLRENSPTLFFSRTVNKIWYAIYGLDDAIKASCSDLPQQVKIIADGVEVPIPDDSQGLIILNLDSYAGGVPLWSRGIPVYNTNGRRKMRRRYSESDFSAYESEPNAFLPQKEKTGSFDGTGNGTEDSKNRDDIQLTSDNSTDITDEKEKQEKFGRVTSCLMPSSCQDGCLDVVSIRGNFHLGQITLGLSKAQLLCQCKKLKVILKKKTPVQVDGEPYLQNKGILRITRKKDPAIMLHRATEEGGGVETEVAKLLDWAEESKMIDHVAHETLMREFSRRIESKTRARRLKSLRTVFDSMAELSNYNNDDLGIID